MNYNNIPVNIVTDDQFYRFAPGTKTLGTKQLDAKKEADKAAQLQAALEFKQRQKEADRNYQLQLSAFDEGKRISDRDYGQKQGVIDWERAAAASQKPVGNEAVYSAAINEMLAGQTRYRRQLAKNDKTAPHNYNYYVSEAISLAQRTGSPLSETQIKELLAQAAALAANVPATTNSTKSNNSDW